MSTLQIGITIALLTLGTMLTRFLPFVVFPANKETPPYIKFLGEVLPYAVMGMLVVYCLKNVSFTSTENFLPHLLAIISILFLHTWKKNTLLSIAGGTLVYMLLVQLVF